MVTWRGLVSPALALQRATRLNPNQLATVQEI